MHPVFACYLKWNKFSRLTIYMLLQQCIFNAAMTQFLSVVGSFSKSNHVFPCFKMNNMSLKYVQQFKYLGHVISNEERDDDDILREVKAMFTHANILTRRFGACLVSVKIALFRSYCICFYGMELWKSYTMSAINRLRSCYVNVWNFSLIIQSITV